MIALEADGGRRYRKLVIADGRIVGAILLGYPQRGRAGPHGDHERLRRHRRLDALRAGRWDVLNELSGDQPLVPAAVA